MIEDADSVKYFGFGCGQVHGYAKRNATTAVDKMRTPQKYLYPPKSSPCEKAESWYGVTGLMAKTASYLLL